MEDELGLVESFEKSRLWQWTKSYLDARREQLFQQSCPNTSELWKKEGAIQEVNRLLRAPQLVLEYYKRQRADDDTLETLNGSDDQVIRHRAILSE